MFALEKNLFVVLILAMSLCGSEVTKQITISSSDRISGFPKVILWAWERPEKLDFINPREVGVAFLAKTFYLQGERVVIRPRLQPLSVPRGTTMIAVVRIESNRAKPLDLSPTKIVSAIAKLARIGGVSAIQIDFDAKVSERNFYRDLIINLRNQLPDSTALSITALASWCIYDNWLSDLPIDEAVPMLFRMGPDRRQVFLYLESGKDFRPSVCRCSLGISTDEAMPKLPSGRRVYIFHPHAWSPVAVSNIIKEVQKWQ